MPDNVNPPAEEKKAWFLSRPVVVWGLVLVGPFALPLLWYSREFKKSVKIVITLAAVVLTYLSYVYTPILLDNLTKRVQEFKTLTKGS